MLAGPENVRSDTARGIANPLDTLYNQNEDKTMARPKSTPVVDNAPTTTPTTISTPPVTIAMDDASKFAVLSAKPYAALTREDRKFLEDFARKQDKAQDGRYEHIGFDADDQGKLQLDVRTINVGPNTKRTEDGRPYLFSLDGFEMTAFGTTWTVGAFYAVQKKAKK